MLNVRNDYLVILVATNNRLELLKRTINSIATGTHCSHEIIVIDGGSTDGTIEYLNSHQGITPVYQGELFGTALSYNLVWRQVESKYTCWLSDDTEIVPGSLDLAVSILEADPEIGMVGLKMKDTVGPGKTEPYMGSLSTYGVLNCNHGVLPMDLLMSVGYFNEGYRSYMIDPDLTASVLCTGNKVVMTKRISILHHREWSEGVDWHKKIKHEMGGIDNRKIYYEKFRFLQNSLSPSVQLKKRFGNSVGRFLFNGSSESFIRCKLNRRDWINLFGGHFIRLSDPLRTINLPYHLLQQIPLHLLKIGTNPYRYLVE